MLPWRVNVFRARILDCYRQVLTIGNWLHCKCNNVAKRVSLVETNSTGMIELNSVKKSFKDYAAIKDLTFKVNSGEIMGLLGANGAGKSTTINLLLGFLQSDSGEVNIDGLDCFRKSAQVRSKIGYIPENVNLYPYMTGLENLAYFAKLAGLKYTKQEFVEMLTKCGLQEDAHKKKVATYSKGMRQKVGIAIAYSKKAQVYLLDEPASGLDPVSSNELSELLKKLAGEGAAILMASHDIFRVREVCHKIGILRQGSLLKEIKSDEVSAQELEQLYLNFMKG